MAQTIGGSPGQPIRRTPNTGAAQQKKAADEQSLLKSDQSVSQNKASVTIGRQNNKTTEDKKLTETPKEKVTLSTANLDQAHESEAPVKQETPSAENQATQAPPQKTAEDLANDFLGTFQGATNDDDKKAISQKTQESMNRLAQMGGDVNAPAVLAAETYNYAKGAISAKMPNASQAEIREAAKSDPEIAKNVKLLDSTAEYLTSLKKLGQGPTTGQTNTAQGQPQGQPQGVTGDGSGTPGPQNLAGGGAPPNGVNPFETMQQMGGMPPGGMPPGGMPGQPGDEVPFYHKTPTEQAQLIQQRNSEMNEVMKIYNEMAQETRKTMAQIHALIQQTNQEIMDIMRGIWLSRAKASSDHHNNVRKLISESWG